MISNNSFCAMSNITELTYPPSDVAGLQQIVSYIAEHVIGTGSFGVVFQVGFHALLQYSIHALLDSVLSIILTSSCRQSAEKLGRLLRSKRFFRTSVTRTGSCKLCKCWIILMLFPLSILSFQQQTKKSCT